MQVRCLNVFELTDQFVNKVVSDIPRQGWVCVIHRDVKNRGVWLRGGLDSLCEIIGSDFESKVGDHRIQQFSLRQEQGVGAQDLIWSEWDDVGIRCTKIRRQHQ